jgi:hypothetical protein
LARPYPLGVVVAELVVLRQHWNPQACARMMVGAAIRGAPRRIAPCALARVAEDCSGKGPPRTKVNAMADHEVEPAASTGKTRLGKIAAYVAGSIICVLALLAVAEWNMKPENPVARIRDECQKNHGNLGPTRVSECLSELVMRRYARESNLP